MNYEEFLILLTDTTPKKAYLVLRENPDHEFKRGHELVISKNAGYSYHYARDVIRGRFESGENSISKNTFYSYYYAKYVIRGRFELGENAISKDAYYSYNYAKDVIRGRFELGEKVIEKSQYKESYAKYVIKNPNFWKNR